MSQPKSYNRSGVTPIHNRIKKKKTKGPFVKGSSSKRQGDSSPKPDLIITVIDVMEKGQHVFSICGVFVHSVDRAFLADIKERICHGDCLQPAGMSRGIDAAMKMAQRNGITAVVRRNPMAKARFDLIAECVAKGEI